MAFPTPPGALPHVLLHQHVVSRGTDFPAKFYAAEESGSRLTFAASELRRRSNLASEVLAANLFPLWRRQPLQNSIAAFSWPSERLAGRKGAFYEQQRRRGELSHNILSSSPRMHVLRPSRAFHFNFNLGKLLVLYKISSS